MRITTRVAAIHTLALLLSALLMVGCGDPKSQAIKQLKKQGFEFTTSGLMSAATSGDLEALALFEEAGMDFEVTDASGNTALIKAAGAGQAAVVERILGIGADPRKVNGVGRDALIAASAKGHEEVARLLFGRGADTSLRDAEGWGALSIAAYNGHAGVVSLLAATSRPAELDDALLVASFTGDAKVINTLLGQGANINVRSPESKTPLMIASESGKLAAVRVLLQNQANPYAVDLNNQTAANLALAAGHEEVNSVILDPATWGSSPEGEKVVGEMVMAQEALAGEGVEETLLEGKPLSGEPAPALVKTEGALAESNPGASQPQPSKVSVANKAPAEPVSQGSPGTGGASAPVVAAEQIGEPIIPKTISASRVLETRRVREEAASKPIVALNGSTIHAREPQQAPVRAMVLAAYHEESLPLVVDGVSGSTASMRRLDQKSGSVPVQEGQVIPGTPYKVKEVSSRFVSSKEGKGRMVDVSRVEVEHLESNSTHVLVKDASGQTADTYAILTAKDSRYRYVVKAGDVFRTTQPEVGARDFQVLEIRPNAVVIEELSSGEITTVARDGIVAP